MGCIEDENHFFNGCEETTKAIAHHVSEILKLLDQDVNREGILKTPERVAKAYQFLTHGTKDEHDLEDLLTSANFSQNYNEMVVVKDIEFYSLCEHHMLPFYGKVHVGYIPNGKVVGLSKIPRVVEIFARRLQIQEQMTMQIKLALEKYLQPKGVAVVIEARHMCMMVRGVQKHQPTTVTSSLCGDFLKDIKTREEFMNLIRSFNSL